MMRTKNTKRTHDVLCRKRRGGFTLIETLVAITILTIAIVAPMSLTSQSLGAAFYSRDQVTAFYLAQEGIEAVRSIRDNNILSTSLGSSRGILEGINFADNESFRVDVHASPATLLSCAQDPDGKCIPLQSNGNIYGYGFCSDHTCDTHFTRTLKKITISNDEVRISVTVKWYTSPYQTRSFTLSDNLYSWVSGTAASQVSGGTTFTNAAAGQTYTVPPSGVTSVKVLVVGGGGGGGWAVDRTGGGGGGGGVVYNANYAVSANQIISVTVGAGGTAGTNNTGAGAGGDSVFGTITAKGGGRGGTGPSNGGVFASIGGSGGGGYHNPADSGKAGTAGQGNAGGSGYDSRVVGKPFAAGGGGGGGGAGAAGTSAKAGDGGVGISNSITGGSVLYGGGGGGGGQNVAAGSGGAGGGGRGGSNGGAGTSGAPNTGGGGGGGSSVGSGAGAAGGAGGSGIVIVVPN